MAEPLDYESREPDTRPTPIGRAEVPRENPPPRALPADFDSLLIRTDDHAAIQAIEAALRRLSIDAMRDRFEVRRANGVAVGLYVKAADLERSAAVRDEVVKRRAKFAGYPRQDVDRADARSPEPRDLRW